MTNMIRNISRIAAVAMISFLVTSSAEAKIEGISGTTFNLTAKAGYISTGDGNDVYVWGYADGGGTVQYPGPTLIVNQGDLITINLTNTLPEPVSIIFPGQEGIVATGGADGILTKEAPALVGTVSYQFTAANAGTYIYHSGTRPEIEVEMGLVGALIVRPTGFDPLNPTAYGHPDSAFSSEREYLFLLTEMDPRIHDTVRKSGFAGLQNTNYLSNYFGLYWFINGRNAPDTMLPPNVPWLPTQPYNSMPMCHPGDRLLMRVIGGGRDLHPFHHHGNHSRVIAKDGRLLESSPGAGADLSHEVFTIQSVPGETVDAIFTWTGEGLGWDVYGHAPGDMMEPGEYGPDHGKPFPVTLPEPQDSTYGAMYPGTPFLGKSALLPPLQGGLNPSASYGFMWHSHTEKELTNFDIFPGGLMTMLMVMPPMMPIME